MRPLQDHRATRLYDDYTFEVELSRDHGRAQWLRDGMEIRASNKYNIYHEAKHHKLTIREVDDRDAGDYAILVKGHRSAARCVITIAYKLNGVCGTFQTKTLVSSTGSFIVSSTFKGNKQVPRVQPAPTLTNMRDVLLTLSVRGLDAGRGQRPPTQP